MMRFIPAMTLGSRHNSGDYPLTSVPVSATRLRISLIEGRFLGASYKAERWRRLRADSQSAPGRLRASFTPVLRPVREMQSLDWDRKGRVTPAWTASQEAWPGAEPRGQSLGESRSGAPEGERTDRKVRCRASQARPRSTRAFRRSAPLFMSRGRT
jgi:hypothetical protein